MFSAKFKLNCNYKHKISNLEHRITKMQISVLTTLLEFNTHRYSFVMHNNLNVHFKHVKILGINESVLSPFIHEIWPWGP